MKGCNCDGGCKHIMHTPKYVREEERDEKGEIIFTFNRFAGYERYCTKHPEKQKKYEEENGPKSSNWVLENVIMDCYEPNETQALLNDMHNLLDKLLGNFLEKKE